MPLSEQQLAERGEIGASDCNRIVAGTDEQRNELWEIKCGLREPPDLTWEWEVYRGTYSEAPIRRWREHELGYAFSDVGKVFRHPKFDWLTCTLDAFDPMRKVTVEIKTTASFDFAMRFYAPQVYIQRDILGCAQAYLLVSVLGHAPVEVPVEFDQAYHDEVIERVLAFKICVDTMTRPHPLPPVYPPEKWRTVDLETDPSLDNIRSEMVEWFKVWLTSKHIAEEHEQAKAEIKALLPADVGHLRYGNMRVDRNKRGAVSIHRREAA